MPATHSNELAGATSLTDLRQIVRAWQAEGLSIGFVPTMGNLHEGHLSLLERARAECDRTVVSIFVNPIQFGTGEDYERYPSTLGADQALLEAHGADLLWTPNLKDLYPDGTDVDTRVTVPQLSNILCGHFRPGHFSGVATVVAKLLVNVQPDAAWFGEKDYQQLLVLKRMARDLALPVAIRSGPIVREHDGLAMSSRNSYLSEDERSRARTLYQVLLEAKGGLSSGMNAAAVVHASWNALERAGFRPEYIEVRRADDLGVPVAGDSDLRILAAAWLGSARLIDNVAVTL